MNQYETLCRNFAVKNLTVLLNLCMLLASSFATAQERKAPQYAAPDVSPITRKFLHFHSYSQEVQKKADQLGYNVSKMKTISKNMIALAQACDEHYQVKEIESGAGDTKRKLKKFLGEALEGYYDLRVALNEQEEELKKAAAPEAIAKLNQGDGNVCTGAERSLEEFFRKSAEATLESGNQIILSGNQLQAPKDRFLPVDRKISHLLNSIMEIADLLEKSEREFYKKYEEEKKRAIEQGVNSALAKLKAGDRVDGMSTSDRWKYNIGKLFMGQKYVDDEFRKAARERGRKLAEQEGPRRLLMKCKNKDPRVVFKEEQKKVFNVAQNYRDVINSVQKLHAKSSELKQEFAARGKSCATTGRIQATSTPANESQVTREKPVVPVNEVQPAKLADPAPKEKTQPRRLASDSSQQRGAFRNRTSRQSSEDWKRTVFNKDGGGN